MKEVRAMWRYMEMWATVLGYVAMCVDIEELGIMDIWWKCVMDLEGCGELWGN